MLHPIRNEIPSPEKDRFPDRSFSRLKIPAGQGGEGKYQFKEEILPVSYTHLDVYKRQGVFYNLQLLNISITTISIIVHPMVYYISVQNTENAEKQNPDKAVLRKEYIHHGKRNH